MAKQSARAKEFWRYVLTMNLTINHFRFFLLLSLVAGGVWAQSSARRDPSDGPSTPDQRRAELRTALKALRARDAQDKDLTEKYVPVNRHLSAQEKADLRQQLRQQRLDALMVRQ